MMTAALSGRISERTATDRSADARPYPVALPVATTVLCGDPVLADGANAYLRGRPEVDVDTGAPDVLLVLADVLDEALRAHIGSRLAAIVAARSGATPRLVLVVDGMSERHLWWAVGRGLSAVLPRSRTSWDDVVAAIMTVRAGEAQLSPSAVGWLLDQVRALDARLAAVGVNAAGLTARETEVLRLLAAGLETADIARELNYSERTIKSCVQAVKERFGLRNRAHAVAHVVRIGAI